MSSPRDAEGRFARENPPGRRLLHYRVGTWSSFLARMQAALPLVQVTVDGVTARPLEALDPGASHEFAGALLDAWAVVGDVLTFYQERLLNEGFLRTAVEPRSVRELVAQLGFPLQPGVASRTMLAISVSGAPGARDGIDVPAGTAAQSIPGTGETPQTFETSAALRARPSWNALVPAQRYTTVAPTLSVTGTQARLVGTGTGLSVGGPVLVAAGDGSSWSFGVVTRVEPGAQARETRVVWATAPGGTRGTGTLADPGVWAFGRTARLFGYNAAPWSSLTTAQKRAQREILGGVFVLDGAGDWVGASGGLPAVGVRTLLVDAAGRVYAGTAGEGIWTSEDGRRGWAAGGPRFADVYALAPGASGTVYAGLGGGRVYRTSDGGASWDSVSGTGATLAVGPHGEPAGVVATRLPAGPVRALFDDGAGTVYAGTDFGLYLAAQASPAWAPAWPASSSPAAAPPSVWCLARTPWGEVVAGTDAGVRSAGDGTPLGHRLPPAAAHGLPNVVRALVADGSDLLAATDAGLFALDGASAGWRYVHGPAGGAGVPLLVRALVQAPQGLLAATGDGVFVRLRGGAWSPLEAAPDGGGTDFPGTDVGSPPDWTGDCGLPIPIPAPAGLNHPDVTTVAAGAGRVVAAAPYAGFALEDWPSPPICGGIVQLAGVIPQVVPGSWMVLQQAPDLAGGGPAPAVAVVKVLAARTLTVERYGRRGQATEVQVEPSAGLEVFDLRATTVCAAARLLPLVSERLPELAPFAGKRLRLAGAVPALPPGRTVSVTGRPIRAAVWPCAGVFVRATETWAPAGLASVDVVAVAWAPGGALLAAVGGAPGAAGPAAGLHASADGGVTWTPAAGLPAGARVHALAAGWDAAWAAAGPLGALFTSADGQSWTAAGTAGSAVTALTLGPAGEVYAAVRDGSVQTRGTDGGWAPAGQPGGKVRALAATADGLAAATAQGVWWLATGAAAWTPWSEGLSNHDVLALAARSGGGLLAGTRGGGVFSAPAPGGAWVADSAGMDAPGARTVAVLAVAADGSAWAGTTGAGCWTRSAEAARWTPAPLGAADDVRALAAGPGGVVAGCGGVPLLVTRAGTRAALGLQPLLALPENSAAELDQGSLSAALEQAFREAGVTLPKTATVRVQEPGEAWWIADADGVLLLRRDAGAVRVRRPAGLATLVEPPSGSPAGVRVADPEGGAGTLTPREGELLWQAASLAAPPLGETGVVAASAAAGLRGTVLTLQAPLANAYDPATVQLCGNLAPATQGATRGGWPRPEVLGSGDAGQGGQRFRLASGPLTWLPGDPPVSTLTVWANGVQWTEVESLAACAPGDFAYEVRLDETGAATVRFGDGVNGARLPNGVANVTAQYRVGIGAAGNLDAGRVTQLRAAPLGVRSATNPVPATGGAAGETPAQAVATAPVRARVLERVVSEQDFRDFALTWPGISRALTRALRDSRGRVQLVVTVAGPAGAEVPDAGVVQELAAAMVQGGAHGRFRVLACEPLPFVLRARVDCDPRREPQAVRLAALAALRRACGPARAVLGRAAAASHPVAVLQAVPGVVGVEMVAFHLAGDSPAVRNCLEARGARMGPHGPLPAQLLLPASPGGIAVLAREAP